MGKLALLFLTMTNIYHEGHWNDFLKGHEDKYSIYVHAAEGMPHDSSFKQYELPYVVPTCWEKTMKAQIALLAEALKDPNNEKFIFLSESTLPIQSFEYVYNRIMQTNKSLFEYHHNPHQSRENSLYKERSLMKFPSKHRFKCTQWIILNRKHAQMMVDDTSCLDKILKYYNQDNELYPATFLSLKKQLKEIEPFDATYVNWDRENPPAMKRRTPFVYTDFKNAQNMEELKKAIATGLLFARKIAEDADLTELDPYLSYKKQP